MGRWLWLHDWCSADASIRVREVCSGFADCGRPPVSFTIGKERPLAFFAEFCGSQADRGVEARVRQLRPRNWPTEERLRIVRETLEPGTAVGDWHGISTGQRCIWRKPMLATAMSRFVPVENVPVEIVPDPPRLSALTPASEPATADAARGFVQITRLALIEQTLESSATARPEQA